MRIHDILYKWSCPVHKDWRLGVPRLWRHHREEIVSEIARIIDRKPGKVNVTLRKDGTMDLDEAIRLVAYLSSGYSAVLVDFE